MPVTYRDENGRPFLSEKEAYLSGASTSPGVYNDPETGKTYTTERALKEAQYKRMHPYG